MCGLGDFHTCLPIDFSNKEIMKQTIETFYTAFANHDWQTMQSCYHERASFSDPVFVNLTANETKAMWHMLTSAAKELTIRFNSIEVNGQLGACSWEAFYNFSKTGRKVHNKLTASFTFEDGKILTHRDSFDLWNWATMALGISGRLLGWTPFIQKKIRLSARKSLKNFIENHPEYRQSI